MIKTTIAVVLSLIILHIYSEDMRFDFKKEYKESNCYYIEDDCRVCVGDVWQYYGGDIESPYYEPEPQEIEILEIVGKYYKYRRDSYFHPLTHYTSDDKFTGWLARDFCNQNKVKRYKILSSGAE